MHIRQGAINGDAVVPGHTIRTVMLSALAAALLFLLYWSLIGLV